MMAEFTFYELYYPLVDHITICTICKKIKNKQNICKAT